MCTLSLYVSLLSANYVLALIVFAAVIRDGLANWDNFAHHWRSGGFVTQYAENESSENEEDRRKNSKGKRRASLKAISTSESDSDSAAVGSIIQGDNRDTDSENLDGYKPLAERNNEEALLAARIKVLTARRASFVQASMQKRWVDSDSDDGDIEMITPGQIVAPIPGNAVLILT